MSTAALITRDDVRLSVAFTPEAQRQKATALEVAAFVGRVSNANENATAVEAQKLLKALLDTIEKARVEAKAPVLEYGRTIDEAVKRFRLEVAEEMARISSLVGDFQTLEGEKERRSIQAKNEALTDLERERAAAIAQAPSHEAIDAINHVFDTRAADLPVHEPARVSGQRVTPDWNITVSDIWLLAKAHPTCVKIEPLVSEIKSLLNHGVKVAGVKADPIVKSTVRATKQAGVIEV